jgi:hypothetical protein
MSDNALAPLSPEARRKEAKHKRQEASRISRERGLPPHENNGEEKDLIQDYGFPVSSYSKGLPHNKRGEVDLHAYEELRHALRTGRPEEFERITLGSPQGRKLVNPQAGLSYELEGPDPQAVTLRPVPRIESRQIIAEMIELYWMALLRDVPFIDLEENPDVAAVAAELKKYQDVLYLPRGVSLTPRTVFRGSTVGSVTGPLISQFLLHPIRHGTLSIPQLQKTVLPRHDYLTDFGIWLKTQDGERVGSDAFDDKRRYIRSMRDLANYVHFDLPYQAYLDAALILLDRQAKDVDAGNPYLPSHTQDGLGTFGAPHVLSLVTEVATRALKAVWFQKWFVHRRLRPEELGGRVEVHRRKLARYPINDTLLSSEAHQRVLSRFGGSLLPQAFPEGSPLHPAYGSGHATVAGACVTILKAWFDGGRPWRGDVVVANAEGDGLVPYTGPDASKLTIGGELDKLAANISVGRCMAGVHWRSDYTESIRLGEQIALGILQEQSILYNERSIFTLVDFDGRTVKVLDGQLLYETPRSRLASKASNPPLPQGLEAPAAW